MSWAAKSKIQLSAIIPTTATRPPGIVFDRRGKKIRIASTETETSAVCHEPSEMSSSVRKNLATSPLNGLRSTLWAGIPSMPPTWPIATCTPTPVRKPTSTVREMKSARKPSRAIRARKRSPAAIRAQRPARPTHCGEAGWSPLIPSATMPAYMITAVAESAPTTRWREEPKSANAAIGIRIV